MSGAGVGRGLVGGAFCLVVGLCSSPGLAQELEQEQTKTFERYQGDTEPEPVADAPASETRLELGLRSGLGIPFGEAKKGVSFNDLTSLQIPIWAEIGGRFGKKRDLHFGLYGAYGITFVSRNIADACEAAEAQFPGLEANCTASDLRLGLQVLYFLRPAPDAPKAKLWLGVGLGWEWFSLREHLTLENESATLSVALNGIDLGLQFGFEYEATKAFGIGPFIALGNSAFFSQNQECTGSCGTIQGGSASIESPSFHNWVFAGVRGSLIL